MKSHLIPLIVATLWIASCSGADNKSVLDHQGGYTCEAPAKTVYAAWGQAGLSKSCIGTDGELAGTFMTAEWGRIFSVENFDAERRHRILDVYDKSGNISRRAVDGVPRKPQ
jgi:hypothetical protein